jgi:uncharacterized protein with von Willebrand factor type A (vWA) domain
VNPYLILVGVAAVSIFGGLSYYKGYEGGQEAVQQAWDKEKAETTAAYNKALQEAVERQQQLQMGADKLRQEKTRETRDLLARNTALANSLRDRQTRPASGAVSSASSAGSSACTGKELYREDGEFLVGVAREADELRVALKQCYAQYSQVRESYEQRR